MDIHKNVDQKKKMRLNYSNGIHTNSIAIVNSCFSSFGSKPEATFARSDESACKKCGSENGNWCLDARK